MVDNGGEHRRAHRVQVIDSGQLADQAIGRLGHVLAQGPLDRRDAERSMLPVKATMTQPSLMEWRISMAHPLVVADGPQGFPPPG